MKLTFCVLLFSLLLSAVSCEEGCPRYCAREFYYADVIPAVDEALDEVYAVTVNLLKRMEDAAEVIERHVDSEYLKLSYMKNVSIKFLERYELQISWLKEEIEKYWKEFLQENDKIVEDTETDTKHMEKKLQNLKDVISWAEAKTDLMTADLTETWRLWGELVKEAIGKTLNKNEDDYPEEEVKKEIVEFAVNRFDNFTAAVLTKSVEAANVKRPKLEELTLRVDAVVSAINATILETGGENLEEEWEIQLQPILDKTPNRILSRQQINDKFQELRVLLSHLMAHIIKENWRD